MRQLLLLCIICWAIIGYVAAWAFTIKSEDGSVTFTRDEINLMLTRKADLEKRIQELEEEVKKPAPGYCV